MMKKLMKYKNYEVVNCYALNIRQGASIESKIIDTVKNGDILQVVTPNAVVVITDIKRIWHSLFFLLFISIITVCSENPAFNSRSHHFPDSTDYKLYWLNTSSSTCRRPP